MEKTIQEEDENTAGIKNNPFEKFGMLLSKAIADHIIDTMVTSNNYIIFSQTKMMYKGEEKTIGNRFVWKRFFDRRDK